MRQANYKGALCAIPFLVAGIYASTAAAADVALDAAPSASYAAGTVGGAAAAVTNIYTVSTATQLRAAINNGGSSAKIIKVVGTIDMTDGTVFTSSTDQASRGVITLPSNTTLIGANASSGIVNGSIVIKDVTQVIVRNLKIVAPCDVAPVWDPTDTATGNYNSNFDAIHVENSTYVWIDHNTITDAPQTDDTLPIGNNSKIVQCHDGAIDITSASDFVAVTYNVIKQHDKTMLIGGSDSATGDAGKLHVTIANNVFDTLTQRVPRVRYGTIHLFNNYFVGSKSDAVYPNSYSVGAGIASQIISQNNVFAITGASNCAGVVKYPSSDTTGTFKDTGSTLNGATLSGCTVSNAVTATVPYSFSVRPVALAKANALAQAGAGKISSSISGSGNIISTAGTVVPAAGETAAYIDTSLSIAFDAAPTLGTTGKIKVWNANTLALVDTIDISNAVASTDTQTDSLLSKYNLEIDAIGSGAVDSSRARYVWYRPVTINGNVATIKLHNNKLAYNTPYYVTIDSTVFTSATIGGVAFAGVGQADGWSFTTRSAPASYTSVTVDDTGTSADFRTVQGALNHVMKYCGTSVTANSCNTVATPKSIYVYNGNYPELMALRNVAGLTITGESRSGVVVGYDNFESFNSGSGATATAAGTAFTTSGKVIGHRVLGGGRASLLVEGADLLTLTNFTLQNPHVRSTSYDNQAEAIYFNTGTTVAAARMVAKQMNFLSQQDTLQLKGYVWVYDSLVAGNVDWIWGNVMVALFENSEIRYVQDTSSNSAGFVLQSRAVGTVTGTGTAATFSATDKGFVFLNSSLTNDGKTRLDGGAQVAYLARNGNPGSGAVDQAIFINTKMGSHIPAEGWCVGTGKSNSVTFQQPVAGQAGLCSASSNPPPQPDVATDTIGWREYGSMDLDGNPLNTSSRLTSITANVYNSATGTTLVTTKTIAPGKVLTAVPAGYDTRANIFYNSTIATGAAGGWAPQP